jgi:hypothetical protein
METNNKIYRVAWIFAAFLIGVSVIVMYMTHRAVPFMMDDLWYSTMLSSEEPIHNLKDIIESQIWHYNNWGGRSMTHGILQLTLLAGEKAADILNVAVTFVLSAVICLASGIKKKQRVLGIWAASAMLSGLNANWKMSMFWQAGAANYLYITVFIIFFLYCYLREINDDKSVIADRKTLPGIGLWIIPLGILAGWSNENMGPAVWLCSLFVMIILYRENKKLPIWMVIGNICCLAGSIMVIAAPGNFVRSAEVEENQYGFLWRCFLRGYAESRGICEYLFLPLLLLMAVIITAVCVLRLDIGRRNKLLLLTALLSWGAMVLSPHYPDRASFGTMVLCICVIISCMRKIIEKRSDMLMPLCAVTLLIWLRGMYYMGEFLAISWGWIK